MKAIAFTTQALALIDNLKPIEKILSYDEFQLLINMSAIFDKADKSKDGIMFIKAYLYAKTIDCTEKTIVQNTLKDYILDSNNKEELKQIKLVENTTKFIDKLTDIAKLLKEQPELGSILDLFTENKSTISPPSMN